MLIMTFDIVGKKIVTRIYNIVLLFMRLQNTPIRRGVKNLIMIRNLVLFTSFLQSDPEDAATIGAVPGNTTWLLGVKFGL